MKHQHTKTSHQQHYGHLMIMLGLSAAVMFALMYAMVDRFPNVRINLNQLYMALLMAAPMGLIELIIMRGMYPDRRRNVAIMIGCVVVLLLSWFGIRRQAAIGDAQFLRSMIPHHAGAILMCREAPVRDAEIIALCRGIVDGQAAEIAQMQKILDRLAGD